MYTILKCALNSVKHSKFGNYIKAETFICKIQQPKPCKNRLINLGCFEGDFVDAFQQ